MEKVRRVRKKERGIKKVLEVERLDRCHTYMLYVLLSSSFLLGNSISSLPAQQVARSSQSPSQNRERIQYRRVLCYISYK